MSSRFDVVFPSQGAALAGRFLRGADDLTLRQPCIVVTGSWLTVKEQMPALYAERLVERGFTAFIFDFAGFGESRGEPRQAEIPARKIGDIAAAAEFVRTVSFVEPSAVGHLAICASAQYALAALARGARIQSYASVAGWYHDTASVAAFYGGAEGLALRLRRAREASEAYLQEGRTVMVPAYRDGDDRAGMFFPLPYYAEASRGAVPEWRNEMAELSWFHWLTFDGLSAADGVSTPSLFVHSDDCALPDNARRVFERLAGPKELLWASGAQTDFYDQPPQVDGAVDAAARHFRETLGR